MNGLYAIDLIRDHQVPTFGPLQNRMVVSRNSLGPLVRMTAIHAYRAALVVAQGGTGVAASAGAGAATASTSAPLAGSGGGVGGGNGPSSLGRPNLSHPTNSTSKSIVSSLYKPSYSQRAADIRVITSRHKMSQWTYERFMESVFFSGGEGVNKEMD